ncbi:MAG: hypothetical protein A2542_00920 [Parcubacteria group bacterium RIFOXYD2_FULL_52_8]|nr:MAG: hypothetical protein A2542_00920 [Parcubacteria group bacterium RIFOXYD2_FULL_52_8]
MEAHSLDVKALLALAYTKAEASPNPSTQNAALLVDATGKVLIGVMNVFVDNISLTPQRLEKPMRYKLSVHAERNAVYLAARAGIPTLGLTMVAPWASCADCAQAIVQSGVKRQVTHKQALDRSGSWMDEVELGLSILREAGVEVVVYDGSIGGVELRRDGVVWQP